MPGNKCLIGIIGAGNMARKHAEAFAAINGVELASVYSRTPDKARNFACDYGIKKVHVSLPEFFEQSYPDIVVITVNAAQMAQTVLDCLSYPGLILAEKPVGLNFEESRKVLASAGQRNVFVALNRRFYQSTMRLLNELQNVSGPRFIEIFDQQDPVAYARLGRDTREAESLMYANSIHLIDYLSLLGRGEVAKIDITSPYHRHQRGVCAAIIHFDSGDTAIYRCAWNQPGPWAVIVTAGQTRWELRPLEKIFRQTLDSRKAVEIETGGMDTDFKPGLLAQAQEAVKASMGQATKLPTLADAHKTMEMIHQIYQL